MRKSINQIFKNDKNLLQNDAVNELIDYCSSLEDEIIESQQTISNENKLIELIKEIYYSLIDTLEEPTNSNENDIDYKESLKNLKKYLESFSRDNRINIH